MLTDAKIRNAKPKATAYKLTDGERLYLLVHANGSKYWQYSYVFAGKERVLSLGKYPVVSLTQARQSRIEAQSLLNQNIDPNAEKRIRKLEAEYKDRDNFKAVAEDWRERNLPNRSQRHDNRTWARLENHVFPYLGKMAVTQIQPMDILMVAKRIEKAGHTATSHTVLALCRSVLQHAVITARLSRNPADNLGGALQPHKEVHFPTLKSPELPDFFKAFDLLQVCEVKKIAFLLLMHTVLRTKELRMGEWPEINFDEKEWLLSEGRTKTEREHIVPLSRQVIALLERLYVLTGNRRWMFPNRDGFVHPYMNENAINDMIEAMGYKGRIVGHGFRALFSTVVNEQSAFNPDAIERQLAHVERNSVRKAYNRALYLEERVKIMQWWSDFLDSQMKKTSSKEDSPKSNEEISQGSSFAVRGITMSAGIVSGNLLFSD